MDTQWFTECNRYYIETAEVSKKGKPKMIPIEVRKMHIVGEFIFTNRYEVNLVKRNGERKFSVKELMKPRKPKWAGQFVAQPKNPWKREGSYTYEQFREWLAVRIGGMDRAEQAISSMLTCPPENVAA